tara:strand:+ start:4527 stop:5213 length:687 start_codon:yes stop_codon:yes gene_type:complete
MSITISITQNNESADVTIPTEWKDITVDYWGRLSTIIAKHQEKSELKKTSHKERYADADDLDKILQDIDFIDSIALNKDIFCFFSGLNDDDMKNVDMAQIEKVIEVIGMLTQEYQPKGIRSFELEGETYYFPSESFKKNTYGDFIEATQLDMTIEHMKNGRYDVLPEQMAILCRRIDEDYDDDIIPEKTEKFKKLTMDIIYEFAFFLTKQSKRLLKISNMYSEKNLKV